MARRRTLTTNLINTLWSIAFGVSLWALINENLQQVRENVPVDIHVTPPPGLAVVYDTPDGRPPIVTCSVRAPSSELAKRGEGFRLEAVFDFQQGNRARSVQVGREEALSLTEFRIALDPEFEIVDASFDPPTILVRLVQEASDNLVVEARLTEIPEGWQARVQRIQPPFVRVSGPRTALATASPLTTRPIEVQPLLEKLGDWRPISAETYRIDALVVPLDTGGAQRLGLSFAREKVEVWIEVSPSEVSRQVDIEPTLLKPFPFPGIPFRLKPAYGSLRITLRGPRRVLEAEGFEQRLHNRVIAVLDPDVELRADAVAKLPVYVYPPEGVSVEGAERESGRYLLPQSFTIEVEAP